ncbi:hypothetical protein C8F01DRAFT_1266464 [Mycena amicta]|nr:hypothetical protein C8F01DRAFT_1266464 [Mycena amicta]
MEFRRRSGIWRATGRQLYAIDSDSARQGLTRPWTMAIDSWTLAMLPAFSTGGPGLDAEAEVDGVLLGRSAVAAPIPGGCDTTPSNRVDNLSTDQLGLADLYHAQEDPSTRTIDTLPRILLRPTPSARPRLFCFAVCVGQRCPRIRFPPPPITTLRESARRGSEIGSGWHPIDIPPASFPARSRPSRRPATYSHSPPPVSQSSSSS